MHRPYRLLKPRKPTPSPATSGKNSKRESRRSPGRRSLNKKPFGETMKNLTVKLIAAMTLATAAGATFAAEVPASFDPKKCAVEYPKASLMNEEQGTTSASFLV